MVSIGSPPGYHACMSPEERSAHVKRLAQRAGLDRCGITRAEAIGRADYLRAWLDAGRAGTMKYLHRHFEKRSDPRRLLEGGRGRSYVPHRSRYR